MSYGKSLSFRQNGFIQPPVENQLDECAPPIKKQKRNANVFDSVAGRVSASGFITGTKSSRYRDTASSSTVAVPPEEVLFRRQSAPVRYEENDFYFAHESLSSECPLPSSDLLQAIHTYSSDFYDNAAVDGGRDDFRSMDETALIAVGILLEEMARESLGDTGDLVLVEGEEISDREHQTDTAPSANLSKQRANRGIRNTYPSSGEELQLVRKKRKKRKKSVTSNADVDPEI
ncbi:hypothetical protein Egran_06971 [Elaphomyces granulatus]|uniref:Uncharacterized protein n=1 Tax=Elaphomyces granulatus TaxID=519963 RepID=A0A232LM80_9EURO|nr:hypothetical protein Egran_06971 [Elaphomyces granulatus]